MFAAVGLVPGSGFLYISNLNMVLKSSKRVCEYTVAVASFCAAVAFAFTSLVISDEHEVAAGNCLVIAQFLLLTASVFGLDYKLGALGQASPRPSQNKD